MLWRLLALAVLVLVAALFVQARRGERRDAVVAGPATAEMPARDAATLESVPAGLARAPLAADPAPVERPQAAVPRSWHAEGSVVAIDDHGERHAGLDGEIEFVIDDMPARIEVRGGRWRLFVPSSARAIDRGRGTLGGRTGRLVLPWWGVPLEGTPYDLHLVFDGAWVLHVLDEETDAPLDDVHVVVGDRAGASNEQHPGNRLGEPIGPSPIRVTVPPLQVGFRAAYFVGSPGYAWRRVELDPADSGERTVHLPRGADLHVELRGLPVDAQPMLLAYPSRDGIGVFGPHGFGSSLALGPRREVRLAGLETGTWMVRVGFGDVAPYGDNDMARAEVTLVRGETHRLVLDVGDRVPLELVEFAGVLDVHEAYGRVVPRARLYAVTTGPDGKQERSVRVAGGDSPGRHSLRAEPLYPGRYVLRIDPFGAVFDVEVPAGGSQGEHWVLPRPRRVQVDVVDAATGAPLAAEVQCRRADENNRWVGNHSISRQSTSAGRATFTMPPGMLEFTVEAADHAHARSLVEDDGQEASVVRIPLPRLSGVRLGYSFEGRLIAVGLQDFPMWRAATTGRRTGGLERTHWWFSEEPGPQEIWLEPGRYTIEPAALPGYERPESVVVDVPVDGFVDVRIDLVRLP